MFAKLNYSIDSFWEENLMFRDKYDFKKIYRKL